jgi:hypothetical protein
MIQNLVQQLKMYQLYAPDAKQSCTAILTEVSLLSSIPPGICQDSILIKPPLLSKSLPIHYSPTILPSDAIQTDSTLKYTTNHKCLTHTHIYIYTHTKKKTFSHRKLVRIINVEFWLYDQTGAIMNKTDFSVQ